MEGLAGALGGKAVSLLKEGRTAAPAVVVGSPNRQEERLGVIVDFDGFFGTPTVSLDHEASSWLGARQRL